jgi:hypothetical protein
MTSGHVEWSSLLDFIETGGAETVGAHLSACGPCAARAARLRRFLDVLQAASTEEPSDELIERTWRMIADARDVNAPDLGWTEVVARLRERLAAGVRRVAASLVADSLVPSPGVRGATTATPRMLVYETDAYGISLALCQRPTTYELRGQVVPRRGTELPRVRSASIQIDRWTRELILSEIGELRADDLPPGELRLALRLGNDEIALGPIRLGPTPE